LNRAGRLPMKKHSKLFFLSVIYFLFTFISIRSYAAELQSIKVLYEDDNINITAIAYFEANIDNVFDVFTNYDNLIAVSSIYKDSGWHSLDEAKEFGIGYTVVEACVLFWFCKTIRRTEEVAMERPQLVTTTVIDDDLAYGETIWRFSELERNTLLNFEMNFSPNFWVPPAIGPWILEQFIAYKSADTLDRIEDIANTQIDSP
jgi:hypothetical protein